MSDFVLIFIIVVGIILLLLMNCRFYSFLTVIFKNNNNYWLAVFMVIMSIPLVITLVFSPITSWTTIIISYSLWYILPVVIMLLLLHNEQRRWITLRDNTRLITVTGVTIAVILMGFGFDVRETSVIYDVFGEAYNLNALHLSIILLLFMFKFESIFFPECPFTLNRETVTRIGLYLLSLFLLITPLGLLSGFLSWNPTITLSIEPIFIFLGIYMTIALPEELITRAYILNSLDHLNESNSNLKKGLYSTTILIATSVLFGMSHWNNTSANAIWYILLASIAGIFYGLSWRYGNLHGAMIVHAVVDWIWLYFFKI